MKKLIGLFSVVFLGVFFGSALASEPPMEEAVWEQPETVMSESEAIVGEVEILAPWPFQPSDSYPGNPEKMTSRIDLVKTDMTVDEDGQIYLFFGIEDPIVESD